MLLDLLKNKNSTELFNPFTCIPAVAKLLQESNKYIKHGPEFIAMRDAGDIEGEKELIRKYSKEWAEALTDKLKFTFEIVGEENIPEQGPIMVYSNHQGLADILAIFYLFRNHFQIGFIAKDEWRKVAFLAKGVEYTRSVFLNRGSGRDAITAMRDACELLDMGFSLAIFPEGTRSKGPEPGVFRHGAYKFAQKAKVPVLPVSLEGSYHVYEETGTYHPCHIKIKVHPLVHIEEMDRHQQTEAFAEIEKTIINGWK